MDEVQLRDSSIAESAMPKVFWRILPLICLAYLCAYMDRVNVSFASVQMNVDLEFSATIYGLGGGLFFLGYALFEVPSNLLLVRFGARPWLARIMMTWGLLAAGMMFVKTPMQFYVMRFLLGVAEAGFFPGVIYYFAGWFPMAFRGRAVSRFYVASPLASIVMGGISGWLLDLNGVAELRGWQWLFLAQGLPSILAGLLVLLFLPDAPVTAKWLSEPERRWLQRTLAEEAASIGEPGSHNVLAAFRNPRVLMLGVIAFLMLGATTSLNLSAPAVLIGWHGSRYHACRLSRECRWIGRCHRDAGDGQILRQERRSPPDCVRLHDRSDERISDAWRFDVAHDRRRGLPALCFNVLYGSDAPRIELGRCDPRSRARGRRCRDQYAGQHRRLCDAVWLGHRQGCDWELSGRADGADCCDRSVGRIHLLASQSRP